MTHPNLLRAALCAAVVSLAAGAAGATGVRGRWTPDSPSPYADESIFDSAARGDSLVVCGNFHYLGDLALGPVALWDGVRWSSFAHADTQLPKRVGRVFALPGGWYATEDGRIWRTTGDGWTQLPGEFDRTISSLALWRGELVAAGEFARVDGDTLGNVVRFDGTRWHALGDDSRTRLDVRFDVRIASFHDTLHVGGFVRLGSERADFAYWDGARWVLPPDDRSFRYGGYRTRFVQVGDALFDAVCLDDRLSEFRAGRWVAHPVPHMPGDRWLVSDDTRTFLVGQTLTEWDGGAWVARAMPADATVDAAELVGGRVVCLDRSSVWMPVGGRRVPLIPGHGPPRGALALATLDGQVFAGFGDSGLHGSARRVNGAWEFDDDVVLWCLDAHDGVMWGGGSFPTADGPQFALARYAGDPASPLLDVRWRPWGAWLSGQPAAFTWYDGAPVVAVTDGDSMRVVRYANGAWETLGAPLGLVPRALRVAGGVLYAGGGQRFYGDRASVPPLYAWRDGAWTPVPFLASGFVGALCDLGGRLAVGGRFGFDDYRGVFVAVWDGAAWDSTTFLSNVHNGGADALTVYHGDLVAGGDLTIGDSRILDAGAARFHDGAWTTMADGPRDIVTAFSVDGDRLLAATDIAYVGTTPNIGVYTWRDGPGILADSLAFVPVIARRAAGTATLHFEVGKFSAVQLRVFDMRGRRIAVPYFGQPTRGAYDIPWDLRDTGGHRVAPGLYVLETIVNGVSSRRRMLVLP